MTAIALPRAPTLGWPSFAGPRASDMPSVEALPHQALTTSGRAALYQALVQLQLPPGTAVLVPTYHCPTMVAPIVQAGLRPRFFAIDALGMPNLAQIERGGMARAGAMIVVHYFGFARSLSAVRAFCDRHGIALLEDCAHCYFGHAGDRPVGAWGDFAIASLTKFFPVPEAGLLASATRPFTLTLDPASRLAQVKGIADTLEQAERFGHLRGLSTVLHGAFALKRLRPRRRELPVMRTTTPLRDRFGGCDMRRVDHAALGVSTWLWRTLPRGRIVAQRRVNYALYASLLGDAPRAQPLLHEADDASSNAPYVFPLWVRDADRVYAALRAQGAPVQRWDLRWPGTPAIDGDFGTAWSRHVLQLLCHQDLGADDIHHTCSALRAILVQAASGEATPLPPHAG